MLHQVSGSIIEWLNDYAPQGIIITDTELVIRGWNRWMEEKSGRAAAATIGLKLFEVFPEITGRGLDYCYSDALNGHPHVLAHRFHEFLISLPMSPPMERMQQSATIAPLMAAGRVTGTLTLIEDVSGRVAQERELRHARDDAESANRAKDKLLATLSHDLRTPFTAILGWARIIRSRVHDVETIHRGIRSIEANALIQLQLIDEVLDTTRLASGKVELAFEDVDLGEIVLSAVDALVPAADAKEIRIESEMPEGICRCWADRKRIHQIVWNLLSNAVKFTPKGGTVRVRLTSTNTHLELTVSDTGIGILPENIDHVFEPLWQSPLAVGHGGLGLGLAIAKQFVELHGGSIRASSEGLGKGAAFTIVLPVQHVNVAS